MLPRGFETDERKKTKDKGLTLRVSNLNTFGKSWYDKVFVGRDVPGLKCEGLFSTDCLDSTVFLTQSIRSEDKL